MDFRVVVNESLLALGIANHLEPNTNKWLLSLVNDWEDGEWRFEKFQQFVWDNVAETALSHREREVLKGRPHTLLVSAARNLRLTDSTDDIGSGSELAEIVLYGIMKHHYRALPVVPKIFYKQNSQDNAKGADSVHIVVDASGRFTLWFGEAKFYSSIENVRLGPIATSVRNALQTDKLKKENAIIINLTDLDELDIEDQTREEIKIALANKHSIDAIKDRINIPILLLHECSRTKKASSLSDDYVKEIADYHYDRACAYFAKQVELLRDVFKYKEVNFHLILLPVPQKRPIIESFLANSRFHRQ